MKFISTKELRTDLPSIRKQLAKGQEFFLIHQSKPIAKLTPVDGLEEATDEEIEQSAIKDMGGDFLTKEEVAYYLALKEYATR